VTRPSDWALTIARNPCAFNRFKPKSLNYLPLAGFRFVYVGFFFVFALAAFGAGASTK
jgi:hypothetical protein